MFKPLHHILDIIEHQPGWETQQQFRLILTHWSEVVGATVAAHTRPTGIYREVLWVATSSSIWSQELTYKRQMILSKLIQKLSPEVICDLTSNLKSDLKSDLKNDLGGGSKDIPEGHNLNQVNQVNQYSQPDQYSQPSDRPVRNSSSINPTNPIPNPQATKNTKNIINIQDIRFSPGQWRARSEDPPILTKHPSYLPPIQKLKPVNNSADNSANNSSPVADNYVANSRLRWEQIQARSSHLPLCPQCQCPTPPGEIDRWRCCALCVTKQWTR